MTYTHFLYLKDPIKIVLHLRNYNTKHCMKCLGQINRDCVVILMYQFEYCCWTVLQIINVFTYLFQWGYKIQARFQIKISCSKIQKLYSLMTLHNEPQKLKIIHPSRQKHLFGMKVFRAIFTYKTKCAYTEKHAI